MIVNFPVKHTSAFNSLIVHIEDLCRDKDEIDYIIGFAQRQMAKNNITEAEVEELKKAAEVRLKQLNRG